MSWSSVGRTADAMSTGTKASTIFKVTAITCTSTTVSYVLKKKGGNQNKV